MDTTCSPASACIRKRSTMKSRHVLTVGTVISTHPKSTEEGILSKRPSKVSTAAHQRYTLAFSMMVYKAFSSDLGFGTSDFLLPKPALLANISVSALMH